MTQLARVLVFACIAPLLTACAQIGPTHLKADQVDYARALGDAQKREILAAIVGLRYADSPSFLTVSQIIAAYNFDASAGATVNAGSGSQPNYALANGSVSYSNHPTFTFTPTTGEAYASAYIRPLAPTLVLPLAEGGIPVDLLLRITAQSIGGLQNGSALGGENSAGAPGFFVLIQALRRLQLAGELNVESRHDHGADRVFLVIGATTSGKSASTSADLLRVRQLLHLSAKTGTYEVVYGQSAGTGDRIPMVTRSVLGILTDLGAQVQVPAAQITDGSTKPTVGLIGGETRPTIIIHSGEKPPEDAYIAIPYGAATYWVARDDFDSKYAFTVVQNLMALAEADTSSKAPIVTIPAN
ncbi:hypothetical protein [Paraburkholderia saeva]|jgi:hypothetical protein|uniref:Uncharacterized protein n=1 Tax=Paraburkholderia saeva TaxID=2777537 RepID=A0A9N8S0M9_9BURK|nr:hypothetical protein [Paraburkholderia saeva]CAG4918001.1 hypothetical protein LMG31841_04741 [Paraburkholderia saeva]